MSIIDGLCDAWAGLIVRKLRFRNKPTRLPGVLVANVRYWPLADIAVAISQQTRARVPLKSGNYEPAPLTMPAPLVGSVRLLNQRP